MIIFCSTKNIYKKINSLLVVLWFFLKYFKKIFGTDCTTNILKKIFLLAFVQRNLKIIKLLLFVQQKFYKK
jgi:hypothetical protein